MLISLRLTAYGNVCAGALRLRDESK